MRKKVRSSHLVPPMAAQTSSGPGAAEPELNRDLRFEVAHQRGARAAVELAEGFEHVMRAQSSYEGLERAAFASREVVKTHAPHRLRPVSKEQRGRRRLRQPFGPEALFSQ